MILYITRFAARSVYRTIPRKGISTTAPTFNQLNPQDQQKFTELWEDYLSRKEHVKKASSSITNEVKASTKSSTTITDKLIFGAITIGLSGIVYITDKHQTLMEKKLDAVDKKIDAVEHTLMGEIAVVNKKIDVVKDQIVAVDKKIDAVEHTLMGEIAVVKGEIAIVDKKIDVMNMKLDHIINLSDKSWSKYLGFTK